jgi:hypothetical protein
MKPFDEAISDHQMEVVKDDGVHRHLKFRRPESITYWFEIVTWPGVLCINGDMGTYVFSRVHDMFEFFRNEHINPSYWSEKLRAFNKNTGVKEFDQEQFEERVKEHFEAYWDGGESDAKDECWEEIESSVLKYFDSEWEAYNAVHEFEFRYNSRYQTGTAVFTFKDFFDGGGTESYTPHFLWCLNAIVWGIKQYDKVTK